MLNKNSKKRVFKESFLLADVKRNVTFKILILIMSNIDIDFQARNLQ